MRMRTSIRHGGKLAAFIAAAWLIASPAITQAAEISRPAASRDSFMPLPRRAGAGISAAQTSAFYPLSSVARIKPGVALRASRSCGAKPASAPVAGGESLAQAPAPSSEERDKLLLYVYDAMR